MNGCRAGLVSLAIVLLSSVAKGDDTVTPGDENLLTQIQISDHFFDNSLGGGTIATGPTELTLYEQACQSSQRLCQYELQCEPSAQSPLGGSLVYSDGGPAMNLGWCDLAVETPVEVTDGMVLEAFRRVPLPASVLMIQPPEGETLVNFETNFYTVAAPFQRTVRLLGQRVDLDITPSRFGWDFGDGSSVSTTGPGSAYPDLEITHVFERKGWVRPRVDTTYGARFRVNGGAWRDVQGTVTMTGSEVGLRVLEATPSLSGQYE